MKKIAAIAMMLAAATAASAQATCPVSGASGTSCTANETTAVVAASQDEKSACCSETEAKATVVAASQESSCCAAESKAGTIVAAAKTATADDCCGACTTGAGVVAASNTDDGCCGACTEEKADATIVGASTTDECGDCNEGPCCAEEMGEKAKAIVAAAPAFAMVVGDTETTCHVTAEKMAGEQGTTVAYKIEGKKYACHEEAGKAYAAALKGYLAKITTVEYKVGDKTTQCSVTAASMAEKANCSVGYKVASFEYHCPVQTKSATLAALKAIDAVRVTYQVGESTFNHAEIAAKVSQITGEPVVKLVGGKAAHCDIEASCYEAQAQIAAAAMALERASQG